MVRFCKIFQVAGEWTPDCNDAVAVQLELHPASVGQSNFNCDDGNIEDNHGNDYFEENYANDNYANDNDN